MGIIDYDVIDGDSNISGVNKYIEPSQDDIPLILKRPFQQTPFIDPDTFTRDGSVMANMDINEYAAKKNAETEAALILNKEIPILPNEIPLEENNETNKTKKEENNSFKKSFNIMRQLNPICQKVDLQKFVKMNNSINNSPLILVSRNEEYEVYAYNAETMSSDANTRISHYAKESKRPYGYNETKINPSNYVPIHVKDYEFSLVKRKNWSNDDIIAIKSDGTRSVTHFSDDRIYSEGNVLNDYPLRTAMYNFRSIFSQMLREYDPAYGDYKYKIQTKQNNSLSSTLLAIEAISDNKFIFRREYSMQYDEACRIVNSFANKKYDMEDDSVYFVLGSLLREHPAFTLHNDTEHSYPNMITVVFDTIVNLDNFLNNNKVKTFVIPFIGKALYLGNMSTCPTWNQIQYAMDETMRVSLTNILADSYNAVKVLSNSNPITYYYKVGNEVRHVVSTFTENKAEEGIYLYYFENEDLKKNVNEPFYIKESKIIKLEEAMAGGFYLSETDCMLDGNTEHHIRSTAAMAGLEAAKTNLMSHQENQNFIKAKMDLLQKEYEAKQKDYENKILLMQKEFETQQKTLEMKIQELEQKSKMEQVKDYYEERSHERKDTTETLKFLPTVATAIGGVIAGVGAISILNGRKGIGAILAGSLKGDLAVIGGVYAIYSIVKGLFKAAKRNNVFGSIKEATGDVWDGVKNVVAGTYSCAKTVVSEIYQGGKSVVSDVYSGAKSVVSDVYDGVCDMASGIGGFVSGLFSW